MLDQTLESAAGDLDEAQSKINATREALERALEVTDSDELRAAIARPERIEAEREEVGRTIAGAGVPACDDGRRSPRIVLAHLRSTRPRRPGSPHS